jgi:DNA repair protein RecO (recombination protein O)
VNVQTLHGYVLHRRPYRETSFLVDMLSLEYGKCRVVAKGVRSAKSDRKSTLQAFQFITCTVSGRGELKNLTSAEVTEKPHQLKGEALFCGMYINELINRCLPAHIICPEVMTQYVRCLEALQAVTMAGDGSAQKHLQAAALREFELVLLDELGVLPDLGVDALDQTPVDNDTQYVFQPEQGLVQAWHHPHLRAFSGALLAKVLAREWSSDSLALAKYLTRYAFAPFIGDKPLKSRELFVSQS